MGGEGPRCALPSREMGPLQPLREQGGGDAALGSNAGRPRARGQGRSARAPSREGRTRERPRSSLPLGRLLFPFPGRAASLGSPPRHARPAGTLPPPLPRSRPSTPGARANSRPGTCPVGPASEPPPPARLRSVSAASGYSGPQPGSAHPGPPPRTGLGPEVPPWFASPSPQLPPARLASALRLSVLLGLGLRPARVPEPQRPESESLLRGRVLSIPLPARPPASGPSPPAPPRPARLPFSDKSLLPRVRPQGPRCSPQFRPLAPTYSPLPLPGARSAAARGAHRRSARTAAAAAAAAAGAGAARRAEQPWGSRSARFGDARLRGLWRLTAPRGVGAGAGAGAPAGAEPGRRRAGATCLPRSAGGAGGAPLAPSCTHPGDLSASPGVRAPHSHRPHPPRPPPSARRPSSLPSRSPPPAPLPGGPVWGTKEPASALSSRTFPAARRTHPLRFELWLERPARSRATAPYPLPAGQPRTWGAGEVERASGLSSGSGLRRNTQSRGVCSDPLFLLHPAPPSPSICFRDNRLKAAQTCQRFGFPWFLVLPPKG